MALFGFDADYVVFEESDDDDEGDESSDDNDEFLSILLNQPNFHTRQSKRKKIADDFEQEMTKELNETMDSLHASNRLVGCKQSDTVSKISTKDESNTQRSDIEYYDDVYFDSDDEKEQDCEGESRRKTRRKHPVISNDDLLYDPNMDQSDQDWIDKCRRRYTPRSNIGNSLTSQQQQQRLPTSDAVLNCPACMTTLCFDCQSHEIYKGQYRAMFVLNCKVDFGKTLRYPQNSKQKCKSKSSLKDETMEKDEDTYHPVFCSICNTQVAVRDTDEVYHFFNVLASFA